MKGQVAATAVAAAASKPFHKSLLVWPARQLERIPWHGARDATGQLLLRRMPASSEQGFLCLLRHFTHHQVSGVLVPDEAVVEAKKQKHHCVLCHHFKYELLYMILKSFA